MASSTTPANKVTRPHAHDYDVRALVTSGEITLTTDGIARRSKA